MKIVLSKEQSSKLLSDEGEVMLEIEGGTTTDAARILAGAMPAFVRFMLGGIDDYADYPVPDDGDETVPGEDDEDEESLS